jgi:glycosyltransferase involved in cell wall biosynthesis
MSTTVLHVHSGNLYGGIETVLATLARETDASSVDHQFALCFEGRFADTARALGRRVHVLGDVQLTRPRSVRIARAALRRVLAEVRPAAIVTHLPWTHAVFGRVLRSGGCPLVQWVHGPIAGPLGSIARLTLPDALICNSDYTRGTLPVLYRSLPTEVILTPVSAPRPFDAAHRARTRDALQTPLDHVVVVQASRLEPWKGHREHLRALARLTDVPHWTAWILGGAQRPEETAYLDELLQLAASLGIADRVRFVGEQADVTPFLAAADLYCQPNTEPEPFGVSYVEALWAGLPVIASDGGAAREIVSAGNGVLVPPDDVARLGVELRTLLTEAGRRRALSAAAPGSAAALCEPRRQSQRVAAFLKDLARRSAA